MFTIVWVGWYKKGNSDKLWGVLEDQNNQYYNFWCRRGAKMQFKIANDSKFSHKEKKGYDKIAVDTLNQIYPGFDEEVLQQLIFGLMADTVRGVNYEL